ncbi:hypothetical protein ES706_01617 [subsurface metagenome]
MQDLDKVLSDTKRNAQEYDSWCTIEYPVLVKQAIGSGLRIKEPPRVSIFEQGYPLFERLAKEIDGWLRFDLSQEELLSELTEYFEYPYYIEETKRGLSFLRVPIKREHPLTFSKGRSVKGRVDLAIFDLYEKAKIGIEVDHLTIKTESALKLASPYFDYRVFVLTGNAKMKEIAESLFTLSKFGVEDGWQNTLVMAKNRGLYLGYLETPPTTVVKGQVVMPL